MVPRLRKLTARWDAVDCAWSGFPGHTLGEKRPNPDLEAALAPPALRAHDTR